MGFETEKKQHATRLHFPKFLENRVDVFESLIDMFTALSCYGTEYLSQNVKIHVGTSSH